MTDKDTCIKQLPISIGFYMIKVNVNVYRNQLHVYDFQQVHRNKYKSYFIFI